MGHPLPTSDELFDAWVALAGDPDALALRFSLPPSALLPLLTEPHFAARAAAWDKLRDHAGRRRALERQDLAAQALLQKIHALEDASELRRAAVALARLSNAALRRSPKTVAAPDAPDRDPAETPSQADGPALSPLLAKLAAALTPLDLAAPAPTTCPTGPPAAAGPAP